jgi:decaprenylphospho-beta-D-erythro-pentofuranosid-2-ulose 2-reductase
MRNAFGQPQTVLVLGGTSDIGLAIVNALASPALQTVVLACRDVAAGQLVAATLTVPTVEVVEFDAERVDTHASVLADVAERFGDLDLVIMAVGVLADTDTVGDDPVAAARLVTANMTGPVAALVAVAARLRHQGHGQIVVLSSVAGERVRASLAVYGGAKAGLDATAQAMSDHLQGSGVSMLIVRPGFVRTRMTAGLSEAPFATTADAVAQATVVGLRRGRRVIWVPGMLRYVFMVMRHLPTPVWRRIAARA